MAQESRNAMELARKALEMIGRYIGEQETLKSRDVIWLLFTFKSFGTESRGYFAARNTQVRLDRGVSFEMRIDLPIPKNVNLTHINHLVSRIIQDGYDFEGIYVAPGELVPVETT